MYNQYFYPYDYRVKGNFFKSFRHINWSSFLDKTGKTLNIINQAIPVIYQVKPLFQNAKTAFKIVSALKNESNGTIKQNERKKDYSISSNSPTFFL